MPTYILLLTSGANVHNHTLRVTTTSCHEEELTPIEVSETLL